MARNIKMSGFYSGAPTNKKFSTYTNLGQLVRELLEEERKLREDCNLVQQSPTVEKIQKENPAEVKDVSEKQDSELPKSKTISTPKAPKSEDKEPRYTKLSNFIPAEVKRDKNEKASIVGKFDEKLQKEQEWDGKFDKKHVVSEAIGKSQRDAQKRRDAEKRNPDRWKDWKGASHPDNLKKSDSLKNEGPTASGKAGRDSQKRRDAEERRKKRDASIDIFKKGSEAGKRLATKDPNWKSASELQMEKPKKTEHKVNEKWAGKQNIKKLDKYGKEEQSLDQLKSKQQQLRNKKDRTEQDSKELKRINFAIRARTGWGKAE